MRKRKRSRHRRWHGRITRLEDQTARWVLRALVHAGAARAALHSISGVDGSLFRALGVRLATDDTVSPTHEPELTEREVLPKLEARLAELERRPSDPSMATDNARLLARVLGLSRAEEAIVAFVIGLDSEEALRECFNTVQTRSMQRTVQQLAVILNIPARQVRTALRPDGPLRSLPLVEFPRIDGPMERPLTLSQGASQALLRPLSDERDLVKHFISPAASASLTLVDYPHAQADAELLLRFLRAALARKAKGVNILIHGPSGTGKTQLASALAKDLGVALDMVAVEDDDNDVLPGHARLERYALCQRMLRGRRNALLVFDEAEDAFPVSGGFIFGRESGRNKAWTNQLLESNTIPTFWVSNSVEQIDRAFIRRFDFVLELGQPPRSVRRRILDKHLAGAKTTPAHLDELAEREELSPGHIEKAARVVKLLRPRTSDQARKDLDRVLNANLKAFAGTPKPRRKSGDLRYDRTLLNTSVSPDAMIAGLSRTRRGTACFYGPPGSGKTELANHIAKTLEMPLHEHRASDLLSMWVGATEKLIARMFETARHDNAVLLLDEADSFLQDRRSARQSWEITQVNEMLTQMEAFDGIFICSTNLMERLDRAALRRFAFKVRFDYLKPEQSERLFREVLTTLGAVETNCVVDDAVMQVRALRNLTPGDFAAVARKMGVLGGAPSAAEIARALEEECAIKGERGGRVLGFAG